MEQYIWQLVTTLTTLIFGSTSLAQLINNRELKRKLAAEATQSEATGENIIIQGLQAEVGRLQQRLSDLDERYMTLENKYYSLMEEITMLREKQHLLKGADAYKSKIYNTNKKK